jgi:protein SCO1/2
MKRLVLALLVAASLTQGAAFAAAPPDPALFAYRQRTGSHLPLNSVLRDADGGLVRLGDLSHGVPMILMLAYFHCPNLCGIVRADLLHALGATGLRAGRDYVLAVLSIDPTETSSDATTAKAQDVWTYELPGADESWHYLTGSADSIQAVADSIGFRDRLDQETKLFIHPAGIVFVTPAGTVSSYLLGVGYTPVDIRSALERADAGDIAAAASPVLLLCFHFDSTTGRYTLDIIKLLRLAGILTVAVIAGTLFLLFRQERGQA